MHGEIMPIAQASIPLNDWGLIHSDITYDVVPVWEGAFFRLDLYLARFFNSMKTLHLNQKLKVVASIQHLMSLKVLVKKNLMKVLLLVVNQYRLRKK